MSGKVTSSRAPVKSAMVTVIDNTDTTRRFQSLTDQTGYYQISIVTTSVNSGTVSLPTKFTVGQNYPNPFSSSTVIPIETIKEAEIHVSIYDILGRLIRKFDIDAQPIGQHSIVWDGKNGAGVKVANGIYFYRVVANGEMQIRKMIFNGNGGGSVVLPRISPLNASFLQMNTVQSAQSSSFTIRIENTNTTIPYILSKEIQNVYISNDTTINFIVDYLPMMVINDDSVRQCIRGFGAANIVGWRPDMTTQEINTAFGTGDGQLGFTLLRLRISPNSNDWASNVATAKAAYDMGVTIIASPWTPPASMKTNSNIVGGELKEDSYASYAAHLKSFADFMSSNGVPIFAVSIQNEPDITVTYESCDWSAEQMIKFLRENAQSIGTKVIAPESYQFRRELSDPILNDSLACVNLDIVGGHIYGGGLSAYPLAEAKGKEIWMTEHLTGETGSANDWSLAFPVATEINDVMKARMNAYVWWYIVRFYGPISDGTNNSGNKGEPTKKGYIMSQFARFIRPGYYMVDCNVYPSLFNKVNGTAYIDPTSNKLVIVAINSDTTQKQSVFRIPSSINVTFVPYTTSEVKNCEREEEFTVTDDSFMYTLDPMSITTFISE